MKFVRSTVEYTAAMAAILALLLNAGVFAYSGRPSSTQASSSPMDNKHESGSSHSKSTQTDTQTTTQEPTQTTQTQGQDDQDGNQGNGNDPTGNQGVGSEGGRLHFTLYSPSSTNNGKDDRGQASILINGNTLDVEISVKKVSPSATFTVVLVAIPISTTSTTTTSTLTVFSTTMSSTSTITTSTVTSAASCTGSSIGTFVTDDEGEGEAALSTTLASGTYALGLVFCSNNIPILVSHPGTIKAAVPQGTESQKDDSDDETTSTSKTSKTTSTSTTTIFSTTMSTTTIFSTSMTSSSTEDDDDQGDKVSAVTEGDSDNGAIRTAMSDKTIPAVISVLNSGVTLSQLDSRFSVAASHLSGNGLMISISAQNVTGSRVLLVNLTGSQWSASSLQSMKVMFDGAPISQAASLTQVLHSSSADQARYIIMLTSSGLQLLVSIPHFSLHTIQLIPVAVPAAGGFTYLDGALLAGAIVFFTAFAAVAYSMRGRVYSLVK